MRSTSGASNGSSESISKIIFREDIPKLDVFIADGLVETDADAIRVKGSGILIIRNIAMCFDAYLEKMMREKPVFSKTV